VFHPQPSDSVDPYDATWRERVLVLGLVYGALVLLLALGMALARSATLELLGLLPATFFVAGKFLPLWAASGKSNFGPYELGVVVWLLDTIWVLNIVYLLEAFYKLGPIRRGLLKVQGNARLVLRAYPRLKRAATIGVILFVLFPVAGTGAIGGSFIGILLGMNRYRLMAAVSFGGFLGGMAMAFAAVHFEGAVRSLRDAQASPWIKYTLIVAVAMIAAMTLWWLNRKYQAALAQARAEDGAS
jgi:uncharacterized membrane protein